MGANGGKASANSGSVSNQQSTSFNNADSRTAIAPEQLPFLSQMWSQAMGQAQPGQARAAADGVTARTMPLMGAAFDRVGALTDASGQIAAQTASLKSGLGQLFSEELNPAISGGAIGAGGFGGARQGVAQGVAAGQIGKAFSQGLGDIVARGNQTALSASQLLPGMATAMQGQAQAGGIAGMDALTRLAGILGGPTVLSSMTQRAGGQSTGSSMSQSSSSDKKFGFSLF